MRKKIRYLLFDMDGLLTDSERVTFDIWKKIFAGYGYELTLDFYLRIIGSTDARIQKTINAEFPGIDAATMVYPQWDGEYEIIAPRGGVPLKKGVTELLDYCDSAGIGKSVVSSNNLHWIETILSADGVYHRFDHTVHGGMVKHGKPDPEPFLISMDLFGAVPEECLVLEDSNNGLIAGRRAGMHVICIPDLKHPSEEALACCDAVLLSLSDVIPWLERHNSEVMI